MTKRETLNNIRIVGDIVSDELSLAIIKKPFIDGYVEIQQSRPLTHKEVVSYLFRMAKYMIAKNGNNCTISTETETLTLSLEVKK